MKMQKKLVVLLVLTLGFSTLAACGKGTIKEAAATEETTPETSSEAAAATTPAETADPDSFVVATGEIQNVWNPAFAVSEGDQDVASLVHLPLLTIDRSGEVIYEATEEVVRAYEGKEYPYLGISKTYIAYNGESNVTTYEIHLKEGLVFSDGRPVTADDLIFTYYVLCDSSYDGPSPVKNQGILGLEAYWKNNSAAPGISVSNEDVSTALNSPTEDLKNEIINQVTRPVLEGEKEWCKANWEKYVSRGYGNSAEEFFVTLYTSSVDANYSAEGKSMDEIVNETINLYGMNYTTLAKNYQGDTAFFNEQVREIVKDYLYQSRLAAAGGTEVPSIQGIRKLGDYAIAIDTYGLDSAKIYDLCNIYILPMHYYGDTSLYNYDAGQFGFTRGDLTTVKAKSAEPVGAGPYQFVKTEGTKVYLEANDLYYQGTPTLAALQLQPMEEAARLAGIADGTLDLAAMTYNLEVEGKLADANAAASTANTAPYAYFGMNTSLMKVGEDANSEQSVNLRKAFGTLLAANRESVCRQYFGTSAKVIEYPYSASSWTVPMVGSEGYQTAYGTKADGTAIYTDGMSAEERNAAALAAAVEYLRLTGYAYDEASGVFTGPPEGGRMEFTVLIPPYMAGDSAVTSILNQTKDTLAALGITLTVQELGDLDEFILQISGRSADMWCAERNTSYEPNLSTYYSTGGENNYYALSNAFVDEIAGRSHLTADYNERKGMYRDSYHTILGAGAEVPFYQKQSALVYNTERVNPDSVPVTSEYYGWQKGIFQLELN